MTVLWIGVALLALMNIALKALGPVLLEPDATSQRTSDLIDGVGQCLLASLVVVTIVGASGADAEAGVIGGVAVAVLLRLAGRHELLCVLAGLVVTAAVRALA
ncbi:AzlD domain-containing protein [Aeromicrobium sp. 179-A 4D2 NHS]|uniref:AzlD domain-containing protein n=1 Tax=Aeromicrobium sp. 179-A 4D2 NHS TaxID=3142375 RepID=UPI0039A2D78B